MGGVAQCPGKSAWRRQPPLSVLAGVGILGEQVRKQWVLRSVGSLQKLSPSLLITSLSLISHES